MTLILSAFTLAPCYPEENTYQEEADRLALELKWQNGSVVAEIGAGRGDLTLLAAERVGASGRVYTTEIDSTALAHLQELATKEKNITALQASTTETNIPPDSCDSIFMRLVYHHLTKPAEIDASLFRSLKPGGLLAVIDTEPRAGTKRVEGVPENRIGHGVPQKVLIDELTAVGFQVVTASNDWPARDAFHPIYIVIFRKPVL
jgi:ubiquinone/menaquinone biosynthesis C-methylase UbiE